MNIFEIVTNVNVSGSVLYQETLNKQGNRFYFGFSLTTIYQNDKFISVCSECDKTSRNIFYFSHKNYSNNCKESLKRYVKKNFKKFTFKLKKATVAA